MTRTRVVIIGGGPAGLLLAHRLHLAGHEAVILERQTRDYVIARIRAGVLEWGSVDMLRDAGLGDRMMKEGFVHDGVGMSFLGQLLRIDFKRFTGKAVMIYGQTEVTKDLYNALDAEDVTIIDEAEDVTPRDVTTDAPHVTYTKNGETHRIDCEYIAGCDGYHGVSRPTIPASILRELRREYPFGWLGVLSETPPVDDELIYCRHRARLRTLLDATQDAEPLLRAVLPRRRGGRLARRSLLGRAEAPPSRRRRRKARDRSVDREVDRTAAQLRRGTAQELQHEKRGPFVSNPEKIEHHFYFQ